jgi:hypothetical protein
VQRGGRAQAGAKDDDGTLACGLLKRIESGERGWSQSRQPGRSRAAAEAGIIHAPHFHRAVVPHLGFVRDPAVRAIGIAIESQHVDLSPPALFRHS